jgi:hypothetical protein
MPLNPTIDNHLKWFNDMPDKVIRDMFEDATLALTEDEKQRIKAWRGAPERKVRWLGRTYCDNLALKYP